ncbi:uncharacterized protein METZ01_LOCUS233449, partial [marine metagenome]
MPKLDSGAGLERKAAIGRVLVELFRGKRICREQAVGANVPAGGMPKAGGVVE